MLGKVVSHYHILEKLGEGGMGVVYKAHDSSLDRIVALKFLPPHLTSDPLQKERFYHEARAASSLNHPNITTIHEIQQDGDDIFLVMEYVDGKTLRKTIEDRRLKIEDCIRYGIMIGEALQEAHSKEIVHRDIKSDNIMITPKGQVKIMD